MPCDSVVLNTVELDKVGDHDLLEKALQGEYGAVQRNGTTFSFIADGYRVTIRNGRASSEMREGSLQQVVGKVKQSYSREAVKMAAKRFGWMIKPGKDANHFQVVKP